MGKSLITKDGFSLIEIIFTITIISILLVVAIPKLFYNIDSANIIKLRSDVALIRNEINNYKNKQILSNDNINLETLDKNDNLLFSFILTSPIIAITNDGGNWSQNSITSYKAWISSDISVNFTYNSNDFTFDCDFNEEYCKELTQ